MHLADGRSVRVQHPEHMALSPTGGSAVVYGKDGGFAILDVLLITGIEVPDGRAKPRRTGAASPLLPCPSRSRIAKARSAMTSPSA